MANNNEITIFAETNFRNERKRFGIKKDDRRRHMYIIGKTGVGKTTLLENMVISDIVHGNGVGVVDPHGEFAERVLNFVPRERINDVVYFNPADTANPIAFNPIEQIDPGQRHLVASGLMGVFKKIWPDVWSARMEYILNNTVLALLEMPGATLLDIMRMFTSKEYRAKVLEHVKDPVISSFWLDEFARYNERFEVEATASIQNKVGQFLSASIIRNIVGQQTSAFDMRTAMDEGKIIVMNLAKGRIGEDNSKLLGGLLVAKLYLAAMSRVDIPDEESRRDFYLYVDEFQNFATESFANILSEARKYRLNLILANQYIAQLTETTTGHNTTVRDAVFGNVGTLINFRIGADDAEFIEKEFEPEFTIQDLVNLPKYQIYLKLMIDGLVSRAFSATTLPPYPRPEESYRDEIINFSRKRYSRSRESIEEEIADWRARFGLEETPSANTPASRKRKKGGARTSGEAAAFETSDGQTLWEAECWAGGEKVLVPFKPTKDKPVYCKKHAHLLKEAEETTIKQKTPEPVSLAEAIKTSEAPPPRKRPAHGGKSKGRAEIDFEGLRQALSEARRE